MRGREPLTRSVQASHLDRFNLVVEKAVHGKSRRDGAEEVAETSARVPAQAGFDAVNYSCKKQGHKCKGYNKTSGQSYKGSTIVNHGT